MNEIESLERSIAKFLRYGVIVSGLIMLIGWIMQFELKGNPFYSYDVYDQISFLRLFEIHLRNEHWGILISYAGLLILISLPVIRVLLTAILFIKQREFILALIAFTVLAGLSFSMLLGIDL